jgi:uncharacterized repeat protein (TIGR03803 family)
MNKAPLLKIACILFAFCTAAAIASPAQILTTLHSFTGFPNDGAGPGALSRGLDGNSYGTTGGGGDNCSPFGCGTVYTITPGGIETMLYSFCPDYPLSCSDGIDPYGALVQATDGNLYETTSAGRFSPSPMTSPSASVTSAAPRFTRSDTSPVCRGLPTMTRIMSIRRTCSPS